MNTPANRSFWRVRSGRREPGIHSDGNILFSRLVIGIIVVGVLALIMLFTIAIW